MSSELISSSGGGRTGAAPRARALRVAVVAAVLGGALLYVVGFAAPHAIHEAAHDARHSLNFPCH